MLKRRPDTMTKTDRSVSVLAGNILGTVAGMLPTIILVGLFMMLWGGRPLPAGQLSVEGIAGILLFPAILVVGIVVHEGLHAVGFMLFARQPRSVISFGIKKLTPYAHSGEVMPVTAYRRAVLLPGLVLGILPALVAVATGSLFLLAVGAFFTFTAGGDFLILWILRRVPRTALVEDHPERVGSYVYLD